METSNLRPETTLDVRKDFDFQGFNNPTPEMKARSRIHQVKARIVNEQRRQRLPPSAITEEMKAQYIQGIKAANEEVNDYIQKNYGHITRAMTKAILRAETIKEGKPVKVILPKKGPNYDDVIDVDAIMRQLDIDYPPVILEYFAPVETGLYLVGRYVSGYFALVNNIRKKHIPNPDILYVSNVQLDPIVDQQPEGSTYRYDRFGRKPLETQIGILSNQLLMGFTDTVLDQLCRLDVLVRNIERFLQFLKENGNAPGIDAEVQRVMDPFIDIANYVRGRYEDGEQLRLATPGDGSFIGLMNAVELVRLMTIFHVAEVVAGVSSQAISGGALIVGVERIRDEMLKAIAQGVISEAEYATIPEFAEVENLWRRNKEQSERYSSVKELELDMRHIRNVFWGATILRRS